MNKEETYNIIENLVNIFTIENGTLKILLLKKTTNPYKGYWMLPSEILKNNEVIEDSINKMVYEKIGISNINIDTCNVYSSIKRNPDTRVVGISYISLIDIKTIELKKEKRDTEASWFPIKELPKLAYDNEKIIKDAIKVLKEKLLKTNVISTLFPSDFTLPELQAVFEEILDKKLDRRNFRKKFVSLELITDTGYKSMGGNGRPAKLYSFNENIKDINLF